MIALAATRRWLTRLLPSDTWRSCRPWSGSRLATSRRRPRRRWAGRADGPQLVRRSWRHLARAVEQLGSDPADAALHEIRKRAKRARYAVELAVSALDADADVLADKLADLQDVLGDLQDAVVAEERLATLVRDGRLASGAAFAAGELACTMGHTRADARDRWLAAWKTARRKELGESSASWPRPGYDLERRFKRSGACPAHGASGPSSELRPATIR